MEDEKDQSDRRTMARVALNALYDPDVFPVDLSDVIKLRGKHGAITRSFLSWCSLKPTAFYSWSEDMCRPLTAYLERGE